MRRFYLEWDRGTMRSPDMVEKFKAYALYFGLTLRHAEERRAAPDLLVVTVSPLREQIIWRLLEENFREIGMTPAACFTSIDSLVERFGPLGAIWRSYGSPSHCRGPSCW